MKNNFQLWCIGLCYSSLLVLTSCQPNQELNNINVENFTVEQDVNNLRRGKGSPIIVFGDSITAGAGVGTEAAYPHILSTSLDLLILNQGRGGDTTATALTRLQQDVLSQEPWLVIVALGGNDFLQQVPLAQTEQNLRQIITRIQQARHCAIAVVLGMNVEPFNGDYKKMYERVAKDTQAYLIPEVLAGLNNPRYLYDRIHPNQIGHQIIANRIAQRLTLLLDKATFPTNYSCVSIR
ncbi:lipolytic protein G-D-S-L family [Stanieria cyanosphaera PCC 7437]|uniref:Lipolytic protein G-D-S-L family n=1 Tax=Stanieria cyanosphaera (strain ATCC 29371 / PCC 7437) TaxID=111780 RepID=K9XRJ0_STAC7|nr:GDSL-type esterase/lipase family protein [Stanieria cyanosphaera]AFZ34671.1 lipolytic protein G-D-S-L family [Stanieria cyanosphaera PCC 7437]